MKKRASIHFSNRLINHQRSQAWERDLYGWIRVAFERLCVQHVKNGPNVCAYGGSGYKLYH